MTDEEKKQLIQKLEAQIAKQKKQVKLFKDILVEIRKIKEEKLTKKETNLLENLNKKLDQA